VTFRDGLGERRHVVDPTGSEALEVLCLRGELSSVPSFEFALRERVSHLAQFRHAYYGRVRGVERLGARDATLAIVSDATPGIRLSDILAKAEERRIPLDINAALCLIRQLVPAVAMLHENAGEAAHGAIGPERLILAPSGRLVIVEYVAGAALEQLRYSRERYWTELRVPLPRTAGLSRFDQRADVTQIGVVALALILGRLLKDDEYPSRVTDLVASTWAVSARGGFEPLPPGMRAWLGRALQLDARNAFASAVEARNELDKVIGDSEFLASPASLDDFLKRYHAEVDKPSAATPSAPRPVAPSVFPSASASPMVPASPTAVAPSTVAAATTPHPAAPPLASVPPRAVESGAAFSGLSPATKPSSSVTPPTQFESPKPPAPAASATTTFAPIAGAGSALPPAKTSTTFTPDTHEPEADEEEEAHVPAKSKKSRWPMLAAVAVIAIVATGGFMARHYLTTTAEVPTTGTLVVTTNPAGAALAVDGQPRGTTPVTLTLSAGAHQIELRGEGDPRVMPVTITAGTQTTQYIELPTVHSTGGQLMVRTEPAGAQVTVDGVARGMSPITVSDLTPGEHAVVLSSAAGSSRQTVTVQRGATASLVVTLAAGETAPQSGWISVKSPVGVQLFENGRLLGTSDTDQIMVPSGKHDLDLVNDPLGYRVSRTVQVPPGKVAAINLELPKGTLALNAVPWAEVWIDGERVGDTPMGNLSLTIGPHDVVFRHPDLGEQHHTAMVTLRGAGRLSVDLRKK
jgi:serine/threonine protein kinase